MVSKITKWMLITFSFYCLMFLMVGCDEPKQNTQPGDFGHLIYKQTPNNIVDWNVAGMYLNDSLVVFGGPPFRVDYQYPIVNIKTGEITGHWVVKTNK